MNKVSKRLSLHFVTKLTGSYRPEPNMLFWGGLIFYSPILTILSLLFFPNVPSVLKKLFSGVHAQSIAGLATVIYSGTSLAAKRIGCLNHRVVTLVADKLLEL